MRSRITRRESLASIASLVVGAPAALHIAAAYARAKEATVDDIETRMRPSLAGAWLTSQTGELHVIEESTLETRVHSVGRQPVVAVRSGVNRISTDAERGFSNALGSSIHWDSGAIWHRLPALSGDWISDSGGGICKVTSEAVSLKLVRADGESTIAEGGTGNTLKSAWET